MKYYQVIKEMSSRFNIRLNMVEHALQYGISEAAREYRAIRKTIRKRVVRFKRGGFRGS